MNLSIPLESERSQRLFLTYVCDRRTYAGLPRSIGQLASISREILSPSAFNRLEADQPDRNPREDKFLNRAKWLQIQDWLTLLSTF